MSSKKDRKNIVSYFCILFLLCGMRTICFAYSEEAESDRMQSYSLDAGEGYDRLGISSGITVRRAVYRTQYQDAVSAPAYGSETAYYGIGSICTAVFVISVILTILAARHLLC